ncbi:MAG: hypothetical protein SPH93_14195 [Clostridium sp.]|uniref:hypothetical protein n=1 Tax=Clostridium sp. TaxID=1506 RepID=UPI002A914099|nr:hypothetical protein [Clostridium sp.]MDY6228787.1 hypothetical protein [Clostridium sp.]
MNKEKIMKLLKNKKVQLIGSLALCGGIAIGISLFILNGDKVYINDKTTSKVEEKVDESKEKKEVVLNNEEEAKKELEELKKSDTSKLSEEEKKELEDKISKAEKKVNEVAEIVSNSSSEDSKSESSEIDKPIDKKSEPVKKHTHTWVDMTEEVVHPEEGHWEEVVISPEQVKEVPVYERIERAICNGCGADITDCALEHMKSEALKGNYACGGYHSEWREIQTGTKKEVIPAVTEKRWIVDKPAWTETKVVGRKCKECGANE